MQPDNLTPSRQGSGDKRQDKTGKTVHEVPRDHRAFEGIKEGPTEDALPRGATEPVSRHANRPERDKLGGNYKGFSPKQSARRK